MMKMSVAIAVYNGGRYFSEQIKSIFAQTCRPFEVVIYDDCSTDSEFISYMASLGRECGAIKVRVFCGSSNVGSTANFERAIRECSGDVVVLADQDDVWHVNKLDSIKSAFARSDGCVGVFSNAWLTNVHGEILGKDLWKSVGVTAKVRKALHTGGREAFLTQLRQNHITGATFAFRREYLDALCPFPRQWVHDGWIATLLTSFGPIVALEEKLIGYRQHGENQIGLEKPTHLVRLKNSAILHQELERTLALGAFVQHGGATWQPYMSQLVDEKKNHLIIRIGEDLKGFQYVLSVIEELRSGRYARYSNGVVSFMKDIILRLLRQ